MPLNCSGLLRVCNDGESPGGQCRPNALGRKTVRLRSANWRSALYNVWLAQVVLRAWTSKATKQRKMSAGVVKSWQEAVAEKQAANTTSSPSWGKVEKIGGAPAPVSIADLRNASLADRLPVDAADAFRELDVWSDVDLRSEVDAADFDVEQAAETSRPPSRIGDRAVVFM